VLRELPLTVWTRGMGAAKAVAAPARALRLLEALLLLVALPALGRGAAVVMGRSGRGTRTAKTS
jgi:hypothetical protein